VETGSNCAPRAYAADGYAFGPPPSETTTPATSEQWTAFELERNVVERARAATFRSSS